MQNASHPPVVLVIAGNDPSGGAGIAADIQTLTALGAHPAPVISALTVQDTRNVLRIEPVNARLLDEQVRTVLADMPVAAVKIGLLADADTGLGVAAVLKQLPSSLPVVMDPVLTAGGGAALAGEVMMRIYREHLFPRATLITPNAAESRRLAPGAAGVAKQAEHFLACGAEHVLITGADEDTPDVHNHLFSRGGAYEAFTWPRLAGTYHGSGCTLASAIAALLAQGRAVSAAVREAQQFTWDALARGWQPGRGQKLPDRRRP